MDETGKAFDTIAADYDRYRAAYPRDFIDMVLSALPGITSGNVCEIGPGSGQATIHLADLGYSITAVEPGADLLELARKRLSGHSEVAFINSPFEEAPLQKDAFDVIFAANALHWVPSRTRWTKPYEILKPGGYVLAVWRWDHPLTGDVGREVNQLLVDQVPGWKIDTMREYEDHVLSFFREMTALDLFTQCQLRRIPYEFEVSSEAYAQWLSTMGMLAKLDPNTRQRVCAGVKERVDRSGGKLSESGETVILTCRKPVL